jgi:hypothetical protein
MDDNVVSDRSSRRIDAPFTGGRNVVSKTGAIRKHVKLESVSIANYVSVSGLSVARQLNEFNTRDWSRIRRIDPVYVGNNKGEMNCF